MNFRTSPGASLVVLAMLIATSWTPLAVWSPAAATTSGGLSGGNLTDFRVALNVMGPTGLQDGAAFGVAPGATSGFDNQLDQVEPPEPVFEERWVQTYLYNATDPNVNLRKLNKSFIPASETLAWTLRTVVKGDGGQVVVNWSASEIAVLNSDFTVQIFDGSTAVANMRSVTNFTYAVTSGTITRDFTIRITLPPAPDLAAEIAVEGSPTEGIPTTVSVVVRNVGNVSSTGATLTLSAHGTNVGTTTLAGLAVGGQTTPTFAWTPPTGGTFLLNATITDVNPPEHQTTSANNIALKTVNVLDYAWKVTANGPVAKTTAPGAAVTYSLLVKNVGNVNDTALITLAGVPSGWTSSISPATVGVVADAQVAVTMTLTPPSASVSSPTTHPVTFVATSQNQTAERAQLVVSTTLDNLPVLSGVTLSPGSPVKAGNVMATLQFSKPMNTSVPVSVRAVHGAGHNYTGVDVSGATFMSSTTATVNLVVASGADGAPQLAWTGGRDASGLSLVEAHGFPFNVDTIAPVTSDNAPSSWRNSSVTVALSVTDASASSTYYTTDNATPTTASMSGNSIVVSTQGIHPLRYFSVDAAGNAEAAKVGGTVKLDMTAPVTQANATGTQGNSGWYTSPIDVSLSSTDALSGVAAIMYRINAGAWTTYSAPFTIAAQGEGVLEYRALDVAGNAETVRTLTVKIDSVTPVTSDNAPSTWQNSTVTVALSVADASASTTYFTTNNATPTTASTSGNSIVLSTDGIYPLRYFSVDAAGNAEAAKVGGTVKLDTTAPVTQVFATGTQGDGGWYTSAINISLSSTDALSGVAAIMYRLNGGAWTGGAVPFSVAAEGENVLEYRAVDVAGNAEATRTLTLKVDTLDPTTGALRTGTLGSDGWYTTPVLVTLFAADRMPGSGLNETRYRIGATDARYIGPFNVTDEGNTTITYYSVDLAGNRNDTGTLTVKIDTIAPTVAINETGAMLLQGQTAAISIAAVDANLRDVQLEAQLPEGDTVAYMTTVSGNTHTSTVGPFASVGDIVLTPVARDLAGHITRGSNVTVRVGDGVAPAVGIVGPILSRVTGTTTVSAFATDNVAVASVRFMIDGVEVANLTASPYEFLWDTTTRVNGPANISVEARDTTNNTRTANRTFTVGNVPSIGAVMVHPTPAAATVTPRAGDTIRVNASITSITPGITARLVYTIDGGVTHVVIHGTAAGDTFTFDLGNAFLGGQVIEYYIQANTTVGGVASSRAPVGTYGTVPVFHAPTPASWTGATAAGASRTIEHAWADIDDARVLVMGDHVLFGMQMVGPFNFSAPALYIVNFDVDADQVVDYNLTTTYTAGANPIVWGQTWNTHAVGAMSTQPTVHQITQPNASAAGYLVLAVDRADLLQALGNPAALNVSFRTIGSEDITGNVAIDAIMPTIVLGTAPALTDAGPAVLTATISDASGIAASALYHSVNGAAYEKAADAAVTSSLYTWTIPVGKMAPGTLAYFVSTRDSAGNTNASAVQTLTIGDATPPTGNISGPAHAPQDQTVTFDVIDTSADAVSFTWTFTGGKTAAGKQVTHAFATPGASTVTLVIRDEYNNSITRTQNIAITDGVRPVVTIVTPTSGSFLPATTSNIAVRAVDTGGVTSVQVSLDDGATYAAATLDGASGNWRLAWNRTALQGVVTVFKIVARGSDAVPNVGVSTITTVTVDGIFPTAAAGADVSGLNGASFAFSGAGSSDNLGLAAYAWDFGDGTSATGASVNKAFANVGTYTVTLTVADLAGNTATDTIVATITAPPPPPATTPAPSNPTDVTLPEIHSFSPTGTITDARPSIRATFSDNVGVSTDTVWLTLDGVAVTPGTITSVEIAHRPAAALSEGVHTVLLSIKDAAGNTATKTWTFTVAATPPPPPTSGTDPIPATPPIPTAEAVNTDVKPETANVTEGKTRETQTESGGLPGAPTSPDVPTATPSPEQTEDKAGTAPAAEAASRGRIPGLGALGVFAALGAAVVALRRRR